MMPTIFQCRVCGKQYPFLKGAYRCMKFPVPRRRFRDGDRVRSMVPSRVIPGAPLDDNEFAIRGDGAISEKLVADTARKIHRRQVRVRWLGLTKLKVDPPSYLYEDELEWIAERNASAVVT